MQFWEVNRGTQVFIFDKNYVGRVHDAIANAPLLTFHVLRLMPNTHCKILNILIIKIIVDIWLIVVA